MLGWITLSAFIIGIVISGLRLVWLMNVPQEHGLIRDPIGLLGLALLLGSILVMLGNGFLSLF